MKIVRAWIQGDEVKTDGEILKRTSSYTGEQIFELYEASSKEVNQAVEAAHDAFAEWSQTSARKRSALLRGLSQLILENLEVLAQLESEDSGKPIRIAREVDIPRAAYNFEFFADLLTGFESEAHSGQAFNFTLRQPLGVVACISPWNLPLYLLTWKVAPALAAGNTVVAKPSEWTPRSAAFLAQLSKKAGFPPGVFNVVQGRGQPTGEALVQNPKVKAVTFTGSTQTGKKIAAHCAPSFKKMALEMGGKNPALVFNDADLSLAIPQLLRASFLNSGQICLCASRIYVEEGIYESFKTSFLEAVSKLKAGNPQEGPTDFGPLVSLEHFNKVQSYLDLASQEKVRVLCGGVPLSFKAQPKSLFIAPTVLEGVAQESRLNQEEIFGPVVTLAPFKDETQALQRANQSAYGLAATVFTQNIDRALRLAKNLEFGIVWINTWMNRDLRTPFGGVKNSGYQREGGFEGLKFFTETKNICIEIRETSL